MIRRYGVAAAVAGLMCVLASGAVDAASKKRTETPPPPAREDGRFCTFYGVKNPKLVVLMVDRTLPVTNAQDRKDADEAMRRALDMVGPGQRLRIVTIREDVGSSQKLYDDCRPGAPKGFSSYFEKPVSSEDLRVDNPVFDKEVRDAVEAAVHEKNRLRQSPQSAIVATIADVGRMYRGQLVGLVLASDMIEGRLADLAPAPDTSLDVRTREKILQKAVELDQVPHLEGVEVQAFKINQWDRRDRPVLTDAAARDLRDFWIDFFRMAGASSVSIN